MKTTIEAYNEDAAIKVIESKIKYHRIDEEKDKEDVSEEFLNFFNDIVNGKGKK